MKTAYHLSLNPGLEKIGVKAQEGLLWAFSRKPCQGMWQACANAQGWNQRKRPTAKVRRVCLYGVALKEGDNVEKVSGFATQAVKVFPGRNKHGNVRRCAAKLLAIKTIQPAEAFRAVVFNSRMLRGVFKMK